MDASIPRREPRGNSACSGSPVASGIGLGPCCSTWPIKDQKDRNALFIRGRDISANLYMFRKARDDARRTRKPPRLLSQYAHYLMDYCTYLRDLAYIVNAFVRSRRYGQDRGHCFASSLLSGHQPV